MRKFYDQYDFNVSRGPYFRSSDELPLSGAHDHPVRFIAFYLPQFHAIPENDTWWGPGFTEWTNVTKALPRYLGHRQPCLPADLGFYDLSSPNVWRAQAALADRAGIYGFCIHDYWFSGRRVLEKPLRALLADQSIDLRFCINWANESWTRRWDGAEHDILLRQSHDPGDDLRYAEEVLLPSFRDPRYIRINNRPLFMLYRPGLLAHPGRTVERWREFFKKKGMEAPYIVAAQAFDLLDPRESGMDAIVGFPPHAGGWDLPDERNRVELLDPCFAGRVHAFEALANRTLLNASREFKVFPGVCPRWDNEPRKPGRGISFYGASPQAYRDWLRLAARKAMDAPTREEAIVFINAWNEWGEGAYLEPDRHYGHAYLIQTRRVLNEFLGEGDRRTETPAELISIPFLEPHLALRNRIRNGVRRVLCRAGMQS